MRSDTRSGKGRVLTIVVLGVIIVAALAVRPIKIRYHESGMRQAWTRTFEHGGTNTQHLVAFERHRDSLVDLGYLVRQSYPIEGIKPRSPEHRALYEALKAHASQANGYFSMQGFESSTPLTVIVWAKPNQLAAWEAIIKSPPAVETKPEPSVTEQESGTGDKRAGVNEP
jgi:hypothetical protein